jgi:hypothetical protein
MAVKKINVACVHRRNISQYDSGERCGPWASCLNIGCQGGEMSKWKHLKLIFHHFWMEWDLSSRDFVRIKWIDPSSVCLINFTHTVFFGLKATLEYRPKGLFIGLILKKIIDRPYPYYRPHLFQVLFADKLLQWISNVICIIFHFCIQLKVIFRFLNLIKQ